MLTSLPLFFTLCSKLKCVLMLNIAFKTQGNINQENYFFFDFCKNQNQQDQKKERFSRTQVIV